MLGLLLDALIIAVLAKLFSGEDEVSFLWALAIAVGAAAVGGGLVFGASGNPDFALLILLGGFAAIALFVALGCWLLLKIDFLKALAVGAVFLVVKIAMVFLFILPALLSS